MGLAMMSDLGEDPKFGVGLDLVCRYRARNKNQLEYS